MKIKSALITQMSGSIGGITGAHNKGGLYLRARSVPSNPGSPQQSDIRSTVAQLSNLWLNELTAEQREAWKTYAEAVLLPSPLGDQRVVTALNHYIRSNVPRIQAGLARIDDAPAFQSIGDYTNPSFTVDGDDDEASITFDNTDSWASETGSAMLIYLSRPANPTINYHTGPYRYAGRINGATGTPPSSPATIELPFPCDAGQRIFLRANVTRVDGRLGAAFRDLADAS